MASSSRVNLMLVATCLLAIVGAVTGQSSTFSEPPSDSSTCSLSVSPTSSLSVNSTASVAESGSLSTSASESSSSTPAASTSRSVSPSSSVSISESASPSEAASESSTISVSPTVSDSDSVTGSSSGSTSLSVSLSGTVSITSTISESASVTCTISDTISITPSVSDTISTSDSRSLTASVSDSPSSTASSSHSPSASCSLSDSVTGSPSESVSQSETPSPVSQSETPSPSISESASETASESPAESQSDSSAVTASASASESFVGTVSSSTSAEVTAPATESATQSPSPSLSDAASHTLQPAPSPSKHCNPACANSTCTVFGGGPDTCTGGCTSGFIVAPPSGCEIAYNLTFSLQCSSTASSCAEITTAGVFVTDATDFLTPLSAALGIGSAVFSVADVACLTSGRMRRELVSGVSIVVTVKATSINMHTVSRLQASVPDLVGEMPTFTVGAISFTTMLSRVSAVTSRCYTSCLTCSDVGADQCYTCVSGNELEVEAGSTTGSCVAPGNPGTKADGPPIGNPGIIAVSVVGGLVVLVVLFAIYRCQRGSNYQRYGGNDGQQRSPGRAEDNVDAANLDVSGLAFSPDSPSANSPEAGGASIEMTSLTEVRGPAVASGRRGSPSKPGVKFTIASPNDDIMANPFDDADNAEGDDDLWTASQLRSGTSDQRRPSQTPAPIGRPQNPGGSRKPTARRA